MIPRDQEDIIAEKKNKVRQKKTRSKKTFYRDYKIKKIQELKIEW